MKKKRKFKKVKEFAMRIKEVYKEAKAALKRSPEEIRKYADKKRSETEKY